MIKQKDEKLVFLLKELARKIAGKNTESIVDVLFGKKNVNEFKIAEQLKITVNQTRNILYKISSYSVLESTRKKDKRKGWYTYFWTINIVKALETMKKMKEHEIDTMQNVLKNREMKAFYICVQDNIEMSEETAMHHNFLCPECGQLLQPVSEEKKLKELNSRMDEAKKELAIIDEELQKILPKPIAPKVKKVKVKKAKVKKKKVKKKAKKKPKKKIKKKKLKKLKKKKVKKKLKKKAKKKKPKKKAKKKVNAKKKKKVKVKKKKRR